MLEVVVDASNVPGEYALTILSECAAFPRRLVFFLKGQLEVRCHHCISALHCTDLMSGMHVSATQPSIFIAGLQRSWSSSIKGSSTICL